MTVSMLQSGVAPRNARRGIWTTLACLAFLLGLIRTGQAIRDDGQSPASFQPVLRSSAAPVRSMTRAQRRLANMAAASGVTVLWDTRLGTPAAVRGLNLGRRQAFSTGRGLALTGRLDQDAVAVLDNLAGLFGIRDARQEFAAGVVAADPLGFHHVRLNQRYQGLKIFGGQLIAHFDRQGQAYAVNGRYVPDIAVETQPEMEATDAVRRAGDDLSALGKTGLTIMAEPELVIFAYHSEPRLAYALTLSADLQVRNIWRYWIDAGDGQILLRYNDVKTVAATISGSILSGEGGGVTNVLGYWDGSTNYCLQNSNWSWSIYNISTNSGYADRSSYAVRTNSDWGASDRTEMSAAKNFEKVEQYYWLQHGRHSFDDGGDWAFANVHYGISYVNAFWSSWSQQFYFGDGDAVYSDPLAVQDVCGHEFTHAVTEWSANLFYAYESGALNESFSDIFGACIEFWAQPDDRPSYPSKHAGQADWLMGEDCWLSGSALRDMRNPSSTVTLAAGDQQPSRYQGTYWYTGSGDNGGVHYNGGVQNFFFYLLSEGGSGTNDGIAYNLTGIGISNAAQIAYRTLTVYCTPYTDYGDIRSAWLNAAQDLNSAWIASVSQTWAAVGYIGDTASSDLGQALNATYLTWLTDSNYAWSVETYDTHDGVSAAISGYPAYGQHSRLDTTVTGPGTLSFWWKVSSRTNANYLRFYVDNNQQTRISGLMNWQQKTYSLTSGVHYLKWLLTADSNTVGEVNYGYMDEVTWTPVWTGTPPATLTVSQGEYTDKARVAWSAVPGATYYEVYRNTQNASNGLSALAQTTALWYDDGSVTPGIYYYYWIKGYNCAAVGPFSGSATGYRRLSPPANLAVSAGAYVDRMRLTWDAVAGASSYKIWRSTNSASATAALIDEIAGTTYDDTNAAPGRTYYYWTSSKKWQAAGVTTSLFSSAVSGWRRSKAATDNGRGDYDGDSRFDPAVYHRATGAWLIMLSASGYQLATYYLGGEGFGPVPGDYDGDGLTDVAVYHEASGLWTALLSSGGNMPVSAVLGGSGYRAQPRDFDGDGQTDPAVYQLSTGTWKVLLSGSRYLRVEMSRWLGGAGYPAIAADYDGDGRVDPAIYQITTVDQGVNALWQVKLSSAGYYTQNWLSWASGLADEFAAPADYDGDGNADAALYNPALSSWNVWPSSIPVSLTLGGAGCVPVPGDYDADGKADPAVYQESAGEWQALLSGSGYVKVTAILGGPGYEAARSAW